MRQRLNAWLWVVPVLLLATWLGARGLNADIIFVDEYWSIRNSGGAYFGPLSPAEIWTQTAEVDPGGVGVLYYVLLAGWGALTGWTPFAARAFSLLVGLLAVAWTYRLGRAMFSARVGVYAAAVIGLSAFFIDYLHEMRSYTLYALFTAFTVWAYWALIRPQRPVSAWHGLALGVGLVGLAYTHYVALVVAAGIGLYHLLFVPKNRRWWWIVAVMAASALLFIPWLGVTLDVVGRGVGDTNRHSTSMAAGQVVETLLVTFGNGGLALLVLVAGYALLKRRRESGLLWFTALVALTAALLVNALVPFMVHLRYLMVLWPLLAVIVGVGMRRLSLAGVHPGAIALVWVGVGVWQVFHPAFINDLFGQIYRAPQAGITTAQQVLRARAHDDDLVLFHISRPGFEPFNFFVLDYLMHGIPGRYEQVERMNNSFARDDNQYLIDVHAALDGAPFVWTLIVPEVPTSQRSGVTDYVLQTEYAHCETVLDRPDIRMGLYARVPGGVNGPAPFFFTTGTGQGDEIRLFPFTSRPDSADGVLHVLLGWALSDDVPKGQYSAALHLEDAAGQLVAQDDHGLPLDWFGCGVGSLAFDGLPPGEYTLLAAVYDWQTGDRLPGTVAATGEQSERVALGTFSLPPG